MSILVTTEQQDDVAKLNRKIENLEKLLEISRNLNSNLNLDNLLFSIVHAATEVTQAEDASILLVDNRSGALYFEATTNAQKDLLSHIAVPLEGSIAGWIVQNGKPLVINDAASDPRHFNQTDKEIDFQTKAMLGVPLQVKGKTIGVLEVLNPSNRTVFSEEDIHSITLLSVQAAVAIENARLFEQSDHIAEIIHELRTPITSVVGFSKLLMVRDDIGRESRISFLATINQEAERLNEMLGKFLDLARLETRRIRFNMVEANICVLVKEAAELLRPQADCRDIAIIYNLPETEVRVLADLDHMKQVFINLISNAVKYNRDSGEITIAVNQQPQSAEIVVHDTGWGIPSDIVDHIFDRFYRVSEHQDKADGNGLGLSIVKEIIDAHSGSIHVQSEINVGSTFTVSLPQKQA